VNLKQHTRTRRHRAATLRAQRRAVREDAAEGVADQHQKTDTPPRENGRTLSQNITLTEDTRHVGSSESVETR